jgi:hypothetical protein
VTSLTVAGERLLCVTSDGASYSLWESSGAGASWRPVRLPAGGAVRPESALVVAAMGDRVVLVADDTTGVRVFAAG